MLSKIKTKLLYIIPMSGSLLIRTANVYAQQSTPTSPISNNILVTHYIVPFVKFLGIGFGLIVTIMLVVGGIQYSAAGDSPQAVEAAKKRIRNAIFALILFILMGAILQFLVPGGIFQ